MGDHAFSRTILTLFIVVVAAHLVGATLLKNAAWGAHVYAFLPLGFWVVMTALAFAAAWWSRKSAFASSLDSAPSVGEKPGRRRPFLLPLLMLMCGLLFWFARVRHTLLGDANTMLSALPGGGTGFHIRSPLTAFVHHHLFELVRGWLPTPTSDARAVEISIGLGSVAAGVLFVPCLVGLAAALRSLLPRATRQASPPAGVLWLLAALLFAQGYILLFFGYVEHYSYHLLLVACYLLFGLRFLAGRSPFAFAALFLVLALGFHVSSVVLVPSFVGLTAIGLRRPHSRRGVVAGLAVFVAAIVALTFWLSRISETYNLIEFFGTWTGQVLRESGSDIRQLFSLAHVRDFANGQLLIGPLGLLLFLPALIFVARGRAWRSGAIIFLGLAGVSYLAASFVVTEANLSLGYARDWDLFAAGGFVFSVAGLGLFLSAASTSRTLAMTLVLALVLSLYHTVPWIAINASSERSIARMVSLPLGGGRGETAIANWYSHQGNRKETVAWLHRALAIHPNINAYALLGLIHIQDQRLDLAADAFANAVRMRPDKSGYRHNLVKALFATGRYEDSLPHYEWLCEKHPLRIEYWTEWSLALQNTGGNGHAILERALPHFKAQQRQNPDGFQANLDLGSLLAALGQSEAALGHLQAALRANPDSPVALFNAGSELMRLRRNHEARICLQRLLKLQPNHPRRKQILSWLREIDTR